MTGKIPYNPCLAIKLPKRVVKKQRALSFEEEKKLLEKCENLRLRTMISLDISTGLREGELLGLLWPDIDLENQVLKVERELTRGKYDGQNLPFEPPKTDNSIREIPLSQETVKLLKAYKIKQLEGKLKAGSLWQNNNLVFCTSAGRPLMASNFYRDLRKAAALASIKDIHPHTLRHTFASRLADNNVHPRTIQALMGHANMKQQEDYTHPSAAALRHAILQLNSQPVEAKKTAENAEKNPSE